jgi:hypothetical protein
MVPVEDDAALLTCEYVAMAIFAASPVRHVSVRAGAVGDEMTENHGQRPYRPLPARSARPWPPMSGQPDGVSIEQLGADRAVLAAPARGSQY